MRGSYLDREAVEAEIDRVRSLGFDELRALWRTTLRPVPAERCGLCHVLP